MEKVKSSVKTPSATSHALIAAYFEPVLIHKLRYYGSVRTNSIIFLISRLGHCHNLKTEPCFSWVQLQVFNAHLHIRAIGVGATP